MKKSLYTIIFLCILSLPAWAQKGVHVGANASVRSIGLIDQVRYGDVDYKYKLTLGGAYGVAAGVNFNDYLGVQGEVNFANGGQLVQITENGGTYNRRISLHYLELPLMFHLSGGNYKTRFTADFGPQWSILTSAKTIDKSPEAGTTTMNSMDRFHTNDFGLVLGGGGDISLIGGLYMNMSLRFYYGLNQINSDPNVILNKVDEKDNLSNAFAGVTVGLHYLFSK